MVVKRTFPLLFAVCISFIAGIVAAYLLVETGQVENGILVTLFFPLVLLALYRYDFLQRYSMVIFCISALSWICITLYVASGLPVYILFCFYFIALSYIVFGTCLLDPKKASLATHDEQKSVSSLFHTSIVWIIIIAVLISLFAISRHYIGNDEGSYTYEALLILAGKIPIRDFITRSPAELALLVGWVYAAGSAIAALKVLSIIFVAGIALLSYRIIRHYQDGTVAAIGTLCIIVSPSFFLTRIIYDTLTVETVVVLAAVLLLWKKKWWSDLLAGLTLGIAFFSRETIAFFILALLAYFLIHKEYKRVLWICTGGAGIAAVFAGIFVPILGFGETLAAFFGLGHVVNQESSLTTIYSVFVALFFLVSIVPFIIIGIVHRDKNKEKNIHLLALWAGATAFFYIAYAFKRGFLLEYGAEILIPVILLVFSSISVSSLKSRVAGLALLMLFPLLLYAATSFPIVTTQLYDGRITISSLIGSGLPFSDYQAINTIVRADTRPGDTIMTGDLAFASDDGLRQFMDLSRPLAYERTTSVYKIYGAKTPDTIGAAFAQNPPKMVILEYHLLISLWPYIATTTNARFEPVYSDYYATVFLRKQ